MRAYVAAVLLLSIPGLCVAQLDTVDVAADCLLGSVAVPSAPPMIGDSFGMQLAAARTCLANEDSDCAESVTEDIDADALNDDERAILAMLRGDTEALGGSSRRARREYRRALNESGATRQIARTSIERLVRLHLDDDDPDDALEQLEALHCGEWRPELLFLQAIAQFALSNFEAAQASVQSAIDTQQASGGDVPADWQSLKAASLRSAESTADDEVICEDVRSINSLIPRERCTTRAQREQEAWMAREWILSGGEFGGVVEVQTIE